jgi:hypothetical protein
MTIAFTTKLFAGALALAAAAGLGATGAAATSFFTFVSGAGTDTGACLRVAPCASFTYAQTQTTNEGTIVCVDPGYYLAVFIIKSLTIDCRAGGGSFSAATSITIDAPGAFVKLLHVGIDGNRTFVPLTIRNAAAVHLDHVVITGSNAAGILDQRTGGQLIISNSLINLNFGVGILVVPGGGNTLPVVLDNVTSTGNNYGVAAAVGARIMIKRSVFSGNTTAGIHADAGVFIGINDTLVSHNQNGIVGIAGSNVALSNSDINSNTNGIAGTTRSYGNNRIFANSNDGTPPTPVGSLSSENGLR